MLIAAAGNDLQDIGNDVIGVYPAAFPSNYAVAASDPFRNSMRYDLSVCNPSGDCQLLELGSNFWR